MHKHFPPNRKFKNTFNKCTVQISYSCKTNLKSEIQLQKQKQHLKKHFTACKVSKYGVFSGPYFNAFGLNTEIYVIQFEYRKIRTRKNSIFGDFSRSACNCNIKGNVSYTTNFLQTYLSQCYTLFKQRKLRIYNNSHNIWHKFTISSKMLPFMES